MTTDPILNTFENYGGTASIAQLSSATALKRTVLADKLNTLKREGKVEHVAGAVWRIKPNFDKVTAAAEGKKVAKAAIKPRKRRVAPVTDKVLASLTKLGGLASVQAISDDTGIPKGSVSDAFYKLKKGGTVTMPAFSTYALVGYTGPKPAQTPAKQAPAPAATEPVVEAPAATEAPVPVEDEVEVKVTPKVISESTEDIVLRALNAVLIDGSVPTTAKGLHAMAKFVTATERLIKVTRA